MSLLAAANIDTSGLTLEEGRHYSQLLGESLKVEYAARVKELTMSGEYSYDEVGLQAIFDRAWPEVVAANQVAKQITVLSQQRRAERLGSSDASQVGEMNSDNDY